MMKKTQILPLTLGLAGLLLVIGLVRWTDSPLHAVATDRAGNVITCTARMDGAVEALFFFDTTTGLLEGIVPARVRNMPVQSRWVANVADDMLAAAKVHGAEIPKTPKFSMVTGAIDAYKTGGNVRPSMDIVYVTEINSGLSIAYMVPWNQALHSNNTVFSSPLWVWTTAKFATGAPVAGN